MITDRQVLRNAAQRTRVTFARREMLNYMQDTGVVSHSTGNLTVPEILAPFGSNSISKKKNNFIKAALFQYIADTKRNL